MDTSPDGNVNDGLPRLALAEMVADIRQALSKLETKLKLESPAHNVDFMDGTIDRDGQIPADPERSSAVISEIREEVSNRAPNPKEPINHSTDGSQNNLSTSEPYTYTHANPSELSDNALRPNEAIHGLSETQLPPTEDALYTANVTNANTTTLSPPTTFSPGLEKLLKWFDILDQAFSDPYTEGNDRGWTLIWRRIKDRILNDQTNPPDGWAKLWKRLRALDEEKIRDYKEDISGQQKWDSVGGLRGGGDSLRNL